MNLALFYKFISAAAERVIIAVVSMITATKIFPPELIGEINIKGIAAAIGAAAGPALVGAAVSAYRWARNKVELFIATKLPRGATIKDVKEVAATSPTLTPKPDPALLAAVSNAVVRKRNNGS